MTTVGSISVGKNITGKGATEREQEARKFEAQGIVVDYADLTIVDKPLAATVYEHGGKLLTEANYRDTERILAVVLADDGSEVAIRLRKVNHLELAQIEENEERNADDAALFAEVDRAWSVVLKAAPYRPITRPASPDQAPPSTLTKLQALVTQTGATLEVVRDGAAIVVLAPDGGVALEMAGAEVGSLRFEAAMLGRGRKHKSACELLLRCVIDLGDLAVAYATSGKAPRADHGRGKADRNIAGAWLS